MVSLTESRKIPTRKILPLFYREQDSSDRQASPSLVQPLTTKAGGRLWSIQFASKGAGAGEGDAAPSCTGLRAAYPLQLLVRFDAGTCVWLGFVYAAPHCLRPRRA